MYQNLFGVRMPEFKVLINRPTSTPKEPMSQPGFVDWVRFDVPRVRLSDWMDVSAMQGPGRYCQWLYKVTQVPTENFWHFVLLLLESSRNIWAWKIWLRIWQCRITLPWNVSTGVLCTNRALKHCELEHWVLFWSGVMNNCAIYIDIPEHKVVIFLFSSYVKGLQNLEQLPTYNHYQNNIWVYLYSI